MHAIQDNIAVSIFRKSLILTGFNYWCWIIPQKMNRKKVHPIFLELHQSADFIKNVS
jgi:hypothetical protein